MKNDTYFLIILGLTVVILMLISQILWGAGFQVQCPYGEKWCTATLKMIEAKNDDPRRTRK